jgi:hypothetical protein
LHACAAGCGADVIFSEESEGRSLNPHFKTVKLEVDSSSQNGQVSVDSFGRLQRAGATATLKTRDSRIVAARSETEEAPRVQQSHLAWYNFSGHDSNAVFESELLAAWFDSSEDGFRASARIEVPQQCDLRRRGRFL